MINRDLHGLVLSSLSMIHRELGLKMCLQPQLQTRPSDYSLLCTLASTTHPSSLILRATLEQRRAQPCEQSICLGNHRRILLAITFHLGFTCAPLVLRLCVHDVRHMLATSPPGSFICEQMISCMETVDWRRTRAYGKWHGLPFCTLWILFRFSRRIDGEAGIGSMNCSRRRSVSL